MRGIWLHKMYAPLKKFLPAPLSSILRSVGTSVAAPILFGIQSGHFRSSLRGRAVDRDGEPIPWYSYPAIDFLRRRNHERRSVLEFGAGQSTLFWASRCGKVVAFENDPRWQKTLRATAPPHVDLIPVSLENSGRYLREIRQALCERRCDKFDLVIIDVPYRREVAELSTQWVRLDGAIVVDDAEECGVSEVFKDRGFQRVDFFGHSPAVLLPHCTSIYFKPGCYLFDSSVPYPRAHSNGRARG